MKHYQERRIPKTDFKFFVKIMTKAELMSKGCFMMLRNLKLIFLFKIHNINVDFYCSKKCSADLVSVIDVIEN